MILWWEIEPKLGWNSNSKGSGRHLSGGSFGGRTPLGSNMMSRISLLCCFTTILHEGEHACFLVCGDLVIWNCLLKVFFHVLPSSTANSSSCDVFFTWFLFLFLLFCFFLFPPLPFPSFPVFACLGWIEGGLWGEFLTMQEGSFGRIR
jgi:hypothetical protein